MILETYNTINIFMRVDNTIILSVFRDKVLKEDFDLEYGKFEKNQKKYDKFNKRYRLQEDKQTKIWNIDYIKVIAQKL